MLTIVGLGNPGTKYRKTYHNIGFLVVDELAEKLKMKFKDKECGALVAKGNHKGVQFVLAKPQTYMNLSGESVKMLVRKYAGDLNDLLVVYDDADLPVGKMRMRQEGSAGTHNGMRSIVSMINSTVFKRLRVGIKTDELKDKEVQIVDLVLSNIAYEDKLIINKCIEEAASAILELIEGKDIQRIEEAINKRK